MPVSSISVVNGYTFIYFEALAQECARVAHGIAMYLDAEATDAWRNSGCTWEVVNLRIVLACIEYRPMLIIILALYTPMNRSNGLRAIARKPHQI
jgi:hypothetical protein